MTVLFWCFVVVLFIQCGVVGYLYRLIRWLEKRADYHHELFVVVDSKIKFVEATVEVTDARLRRDFEARYDEIKERFAADIRAIDEAALRIEAIGPAVVNVKGD